MKLKAFISVIDADETIHVRDESGRDYCGSVRDCYGDDYLLNADVLRVAIICGVLTIDTAI